MTKEYVGKGCPSKDQKKVILINKAISESDLLFVDDVLVKPFCFEEGQLSYMDLSSGENTFCNVNLCEVKGYEAQCSYL